MVSSRFQPRTAAQAVGIIALILATLAPGPAAAVDIFNRASEVDLLLRDPRRAKGLKVTVELRFLTVADEFLERVGVDFSGTVSGAANKNGQAVEGAKIVLEAYKIKQSETGSGQTVTRTGRQTVQTDADGRYSLPLKDLVNAEAREEILAGEVVSLRIEGTGKNAKKLDHLFLRAEAATGGLIP